MKAPPMTDLPPPRTEMPDTDATAPDLRDAPPALSGTSRSDHDAPDPAPFLARPMPALPILPTPSDPRLTRAVTGRDQTGAEISIPVVEERPLTIYQIGRASCRERV